MSRAKYRTKEFIENSLTLDVNEVSALLGISVPLVWAMVQRGELKTIRLGKLVRIPRGWLMALIGDDNKPEETPQG